MIKNLASCLALTLCVFLASCSSTTEPGDNNNGTTQDVGPSASATWDPNFKFSGSGSDTTSKGLSGSVVKLVKYNGKLYGVGSFDYINGSAYPVHSIFVWTGASIDSLPKQIGPVDVFYELAGIRSAMVYNGNLEVSGTYALNGDNYISKWDGSSWTTGTTQSSFSFETVSNGTSAYDFQTDQGSTFPYDSSTVYKYNSTSFDAIAGFRERGNTNEEITALAVDNGTVYVATHEIGSIVFDAKAWVYKYENGAMKELKSSTGDIKGTITKLLWVGNTLYGLGEIQLYNGYGGMVKWNGTDWETLGDITFEADGLTNPVMDAVADKNGNLYVATQDAVFKYNGTTVTKLGTVSGGQINTIAIMGDKLFLGGSFSSVDGVLSNNFAVLH